MKKECLKNIIDDFIEHNKSELDSLEYEYLVQASNILID